MLKHLCHFINELKSQSLRSIPISINVSQVQLSQEGFAKNFIKIVNEYSIDVSSIEVEIIESMSLESATTTHNIFELVKAGISISLDDFGTGTHPCHIYKIYHPKH